MRKLLLILITTFTLCSCDKDNDKPTNPVSQLPPATQTGENTFGCLINGEPFVVSNTSNENNSYVLNSNTVPKGEYYIENQNCFYFTSSNYSGSITITKLDNINFIVSGTFEFKSISDNCEGIIDITNGRFDLQYIP